MKWFKRISLFVLTNLLVIVTISIVWNFVSLFLGMQGLNTYFPLLIAFCLVWGMGGAFISLMLSKVMAKWMMRVKIIDPATSDPHLRHLVQQVHRLASLAGLPKPPEVGVYDSPEINAFATGPSRSNSLVAVSTGLLDRMNSQEVEGVLGHEVAHIANGDMVTMTLIQGVVNAFVLFFARLLANAIASQVDDRARHSVQFALTIVFDIAFAILGSMLVAYFSRRREFRADHGGAVYAGKDKMLAGLRRLQAQFGQIAPDSSSMATLKISTRPGGLWKLFSTHPPLEERIARLETAVIVR